MASIDSQVLKFPSSLGDQLWNGADPVAADLASAPSAIVNGAMSSEALNGTVGQWLGANTPGSLDSWLSQPNIGGSSTNLSPAPMTGVPGAPAAKAKGWYSSQPVYIKAMIVVGAIGLILIGVAKMFAPEIGTAAKAAAA
jgi:hypothetical protein